MHRQILTALAVVAGLAAPMSAQARFSVGAGDLIWADGQTFTYEEYEEYKKTHPADGSAPSAPPQPQAQQQPQPQVQQQPQPQYQAPPTTGVVNGQPVVTIVPPPVSAPLALPATTSVAVVPPGTAPQPAPTYAAAPVLTPPPATAPALRAASCKTTQSFQEFPGDAEKFDCGAAGKLTRQEMLTQGWKIDFVEKLPAVAGQATPNIYKIILSR